MHRAATVSLIAALCLAVCAIAVKGTERIKIGPRKGQIGERLTLAGRFTGHRTVSGQLATVYPSFETCSGSSRFSART